MTAKEYVLKHRPTARKEIQRTNGGYRFYLIRERGAYMYLGSGDTEAKAWKNAKEKISPSD